MGHQAELSVISQPYAAMPAKPGFLQRRLVHKNPNVVDHLPEEYKTDVRQKMQNAYAMPDYSDAKRALEQFHRELMELTRPAVLEEGMEGTFTVDQLQGKTESL